MIRIHELTEGEWPSVAAEPVRSVVATAPPADKVAARRLLFVDYARALAVLFMVQGHALDVLMAQPYRSGAVWDGWLYLRGLTSCSFLTLSGIAFSVTSLRHWDAQRCWSPRVVKRVRRALFFLALAYLVRFPAAHINHLKWVSPAGWQSFFVVDILQVVAVTLLGLQALVALSRGPRQFAVVAGALAAVVALATPLVWSHDWSSWPAWLAAYLTPGSGSLFPLFPWAAYLLAGAALGAAYEGAWRSASTDDRPRWLTGLGVAAIVVGAASMLVPWSVYAQADVWRSSPAAFLVRGGSVLILLGWLASMSRGMTAAPGLVRALAAESLLVYIVHVCVLYGSRWNTGLGRLVGPQEPVWTFAWIVVLLAGSGVLALAWFHAKAQTPRLASVIRLAMFTWLFGSVLV